MFRGVLAKSEFQIKKERTSPFYSEMHSAVMYLKVKILARGVEKFYITIERHHKICYIQRVNFIGVFY